MIEKTHNYLDTVVTYLFKEATYDKRHLVVIFTGFSEKYSFINVGNAFKCNVIWIKDDYEGMECYYLGKNGDLHFSEAVNNVIENVLAELSLNKSQCTLLGGSKGAFSALFLGTKYQYSNILASAPTTRIGDRMSRLRPDIASFMMGERSPDYYDKLLFNSIDDDLNINKNIYLFISKDDGCYEEHQRDLLPLLKKYHNFNLIMINSDLVFKHNRVTAYSVPLIISFVTSLIEGIPASFKYLESGYKRKKLSQKQISANVLSIGILDQIRVEDDYLILKGAAFFSGISADKKHGYNKKLILKHKDCNYDYLLDLVGDEMYSARFFQNQFIDYEFAGFVNSPQNRIDLSKINCGVYQLYVFINLLDIKKEEKPLFFDSALDAKFISLGIEYRIWNEDQNVFLSKRELLDNFSEQREVFNLSTLEVRDLRLFIRGQYAIPGVELSNWGDAKYYLVLSDSKTTVSYRLGMEHNASLNKEVGHGYGLYHKSCFSTLKHQGIILDGLLDSVYSIYVVLSYKGTIFRKKLSEKLFKVKNNLSLQ